MSRKIGKGILNLLFILSILAFSWLIASWIDVNLHNGLDQYGNPIGGTRWEHNAFVLLTEHCA